VYGSTFNKIYPKIRNRLAKLGWSDPRFEDVRPAPPEAGEPAPRVEGGEIRESSVGIKTVCTCGQELRSSVSTQGGEIVVTVEEPCKNCVRQHVVAFVQRAQEMVEG
jgi:hypothetical protein